MTFADFARLCADLVSARSRLAKTARTAEFLALLTPEEVPSAVAFLTGRAFPASDPRVVEVGWATLDEAADKAGPPPDVPGLSLLDVAGAFADIAAAVGPGAHRARSERLRDLLRRATADERRILGGIVLGEMRIGLHEGLIGDAIARAAGVSPEQVRRAALLRSDPADVARIALAEGAEGLRRIGVRLFAPLLPMLADIAEDFSEVLETHGGRTALEFKYDGARIQLHKQGKAVRIWSRRRTEVTGSMPEVVAIAQSDLCADSLILDGEVVAVGPDGRPLPFQELMRRYRRIHEVEETAREVPMALHLFDCLLVDGRPLIDEGYEARWSALDRVTAGRHLARRMLTDDVGRAEAFLRDALAAGHEGVMAKDPTSRYTPGSRGRRWLKIKPAETVDCVIIAAEWGSGRRRGWLSNYHLAVGDGAGGFAHVGKTFKGLTDDEFRTMTARLRSLMVEDIGHTVTVRPEVVVEVAYNEIQRSPRYPSGLALRFARITRVRDDKGPGQVSTLAELRTLYERQFTTKSRGDS